MLAMASNRTYGLNLDAAETMQPQPFSLVGDGAGSIFKIFTTAAALEMGMGINAQLDAPARFEAKGLGTGGAKGCPQNTWCVQNAGNYRGSMNVTDALGDVPEHRLRQAHLAGRRAAHGRHGGQAGAAVLRAAWHRARLRPGEQREPGRVRQAPELGVVHARAHRGQRARTVQRRGDARLGWHVVPAQPDRQGLRPHRQRGRGHDGNLRAGSPRGPGQHAWPTR